MMKILIKPKFYFIFRVFFIELLLFFLISPIGKASEIIGTKSQKAVSILSMADIKNTESLIYVNALNLLNNTNLVSLSDIKEKVLQENKSYFIDLSTIDYRKKKSLLENMFGINFDADFLIIGLYKDNLIYTPVFSGDDHLLNTVLLRNSNEQHSKKNNSATYAVKKEDGSLPHLAFYLDVNRKIDDSECTFSASQIWNRGQKVFCNQANISLVYRINLMRSLTHGTVGSATPDAKLVRISLDAESAGAGIQLNNTLNSITSDVGHKIVSGWTKSYVTDAIAKDYKFSISASNNKAAILKTFPASNLNTNYFNSETSGFEIGVTGGPEAGSDGAKGKLEAKYSYTQSRSLSYNTQDYRVERSAPNAQKIIFTWTREQYPDAESLLFKTTSTIWDDGLPVDLKRIRPISYQGFIPNFDVVYKAAPETSGSTAFTIDSSVNLWTIYTAAFKHYYVFGGHLSFQGQNGWQKYRRIDEPVSFEVNWNHPIFSGGRPTNLQLGGFNNKCISYGDNAKIEIATCDLKSIAQSFTYDRHGRYISTANTDKCLDIKDLNAFQPCNASLSQRWKWVKDSDLLQNDAQDQYLAQDIEKNRLVSAFQGTKNINMRTITRFTEIYGL